jgi:hypothetical protein
MLWLPTKQTRKAIARIKRRHRRRRLARFLLFLFIFFGLKAASAPSSQALLVQVNQVTASYRFDFVNWESMAVASEIGRRWHSPPLPDNQIGRQNLVQSFLEQEQRIRELEDELDRIYAANPNPGQAAQALEQKLAEIKSAQAEIIPQVETILSRQVETVLRDEGFTIAGQVFPPVSLRFTDPPTSLILSPRDKIKNQHSVQLQPDLDNKVRSKIEATLDQRGDVSSYVTDVGGLASYPPMIIKYPSLIYLTEVIAHEWTHHYLYTFPTNIAWGYQTYPQLTTINETTADIVGREISRRVITHYYPDWADRLPPLDDTGQPAPSEPSEFHLAMRRIRQEVDRLLAEGQIEEAEAFMEAERLKLVEKGYNLRKLNQAYFAFHGSYALSPASIDPIGPQLRQLRAISPSLKAFVNRVGWINSYEDYLAWLAEAGIKEENT